VKRALIGARSDGPAPPPLASAAVSPERLWAIGDIHGCADLLTALLDHIDQTRPPRQPLNLVFLGDYVDRGPDSSLVVEALIRLRHRSGVCAQFIRGNHDDMLIKFLLDPAAGPAWGVMGGTTTLASYGVRPPVDNRSAEAWTVACRALRRRMPYRHLEFLAGLRPFVIAGDYFLTHAGVRPDRPLAEQTSVDLMWIRQAFLNDPRGLERVIVHGHTPTEEPFSDYRRVGVDTGAYATGVLTAVLLDGAKRSFLQARRQPGGAIGVVTQTAAGAGAGRIKEVG
jgi:serine/threonine protein phosphatase 1